MAVYHIGDIGADQSDILARIMNPNGGTRCNKLEVPWEALSTSAQYLLEGDKKFRFQYKNDGKWYVMKMVEIEPPEEVTV